MLAQLPLCVARALAAGVRHGPGASNDHQTPAAYPGEELLGDRSPWSRRRESATGAARKADMAITTRITLVTRPGCHLCDDAKAALERMGEPWTEVNVDDDDELCREYSDRVPVILLDGKEHGYWRVEEERLRRDLDRQYRQ
jgi:glutaredoxin